jgi:hypothetical protein
VLDRLSVCWLAHRFDSDNSTWPPWLSTPAALASTVVWSLPSISTSTCQYRALFNGFVLKELLKEGKRAVIQAITLRHLARERIRATPELVYHSARSAFAVADDAGIDSLATCLWAIRDGYGTARPAEMASALVRAAVEHGTQARDLRNLRRIVICEPQRDDPKRYWLAVEAVLQARHLQAAHRTPRKFVAGLPPRNRRNRTLAE